MCGIAGVASSSPIPDVNLLGHMCDTMTHRGPDDAGIWSTEDGRVALGHRRLAVIDLSPEAHQPMADVSGRLHITFNGEIYGFQELRLELEGFGHRFRTTSDTEVILNAYREWGTACLEHLNGMFAFALYDDDSGLLFLARDRAGEKPLFYRHACGRFLFASELKGLVVDPSIPRVVDPESLDHYLAYGYVPGEQCILEGVRKLGAGQAMTYDIESNRLHTWHYWNLPETTCDRFPKSADLLEELEKLFEDSVRLRLIADVPVGILLSGGLDSSLVVAMASRVTSGRVKTFTVSFPGHGAFDEGPFARIVADHFGTDHTELVAEPSSVGIMPLLSRQYDEPIGDHSIIPSCLLARLVRKHVTVALGGDGGDELFGGYPHYNYLLKLERMRNYIPQPIRTLIGAIAARAMPIGMRGRNHLIGFQRNFPYSLAHVNLYFDARSRRRLLSPLFGNGRMQPSKPEIFKVNMCTFGNTHLQNATRLDFRTTLADDYLVKVDRASMLSSLEVRSPFLDHRLVEFAFSRVPDNLRAAKKERKILLRILAKKLLPEKLDLERKRGFELPLASWFKGEWGDYLQAVLSEVDPTIFNRGIIGDLIAGQRRGYDNTNRLFLLVMFELWRREYRATVRPPHFPSDY